MSSWPQVLEPVHGPFPVDKLRGAVLGMGPHAPATAALVREGFLPPDLMTGFTLLLLARQPRRSPPKDAAARATPVAGSVWVRERVTYHRPIALDEVFEIQGSGTGRHVRKGRRYGTTVSRTHAADGSRLATNVTTGLLSYRQDPDLADEVQGQPVEQTPAPEIDQSVAASNPCLEALGAARVGQILGGASLEVSLEMMRARETARSDNPIHSDPEVARAAGLARPIAGGSHVQAFALELLMAEWGSQVLLHGACVDCRWKAPTEAGASITPRAEVVAAEPDRVEVALEVRLTDGPTAMVGSVVIPRPA